MNLGMAEKANKLFDCRMLDKLGVPIENLVADSRRVKPGDTFLAYAGDQFDARAYIPQAISAGANAVLWEQQDFSWNADWQVPDLPVTDLKSQSGFIANHVYGCPSEKMCVTGITGTNGKTSCSHWYAQAMSILGKKTAVMGTLGNGFPGVLKPAVNTTPDAVSLQQDLAGFLQADAENVVMEVSSHGAVQGRINGATFSIAVLTNLSRDHLDYHGTMEAYAAAKSRLFFWPGLKYAVLNMDDIFGLELSRQLTTQPVHLIGYGFRKPELDVQTDQFSMLLGENLVANMDGLSFDVDFSGKIEHLTFDIVGQFNASNLLAVLAAMLASGVDFSDAVHALKQVTTIPGRMEKFGGQHQPTVIVDYAHTPDALEKVLQTIKSMLNSTSSKTAKLFCVFGCGGGRDQGKRKLMGQVASRLADEIVITNDNPRHETPSAIIEDIVTGVSGDFNIEENRASAIYQAIFSAKPGDVVLVAGKGHEAYQQIGDATAPFDDRQVIQKILNELANSAQVSS